MLKTDFVKCLLTSNCKNKMYRYACNVVARIITNM